MIIIYVDIEKELQDALCGGVQPPSSAMPYRVSLM